MQNNMDQLLPPGLSLAQERKWYFLSLGATSLISTAIFLSHYTTARSNLFSQHFSRTMLIPGAMIEPFSVLLDHVMDPLILLLLCLPFWVVLHYLYFRQGSMSIYLMRRLPDRTLLHRQCWTLPVLGLMLVLLAGLLLLGIYYLIYRYATPAQCLSLAYV